MLKKFLVTAIVGLLMLTSQIVSAAVDWNAVKHCNTKAELARYVENERRKGQTTFHVVLTNDSILPNTWRNRDFDKNEFYNLVVCHDVKPSIGWIDGKNMGIPFRLIEYPGTRVANAYLSKYSADIVWLNLSDEERTLYSEALKIVNEANNRSSEVEKARYIHDVICDSVKEYKDENERNETAIGAIIDRYAQCQGFTDAFYMLGRMAGLNVGRIRGTINNGETQHVWNWITLNGRTYFVDVTQDYVESSDKHKYFIVPSQNWCS